MSTPAARSHRIRSTIFFSIVTGMIVLVNTPVPRLLIGALFGTSVGESIGASLRGLTRDLFLLLLVSIYFEWIRSKVQSQSLAAIEKDITEVKEAVRDLVPARMRAMALESTEPRELVNLAARRLFHTEHGTETVVRQLAETKTPFDDVSVEIRTLQVNGNVVSVFSSISLEAELHDIKLAVTWRPEHNSTLAVSGFNFFDVVTLLVDSGGTMEKSLPASVKLYRRDDSGRLRAVQLVTMPKAEQAALLSPPEGMTHDDFAVLELPPEVKLRGKEKIRVEYFYDVDTSEHFVFWCADRPIFLRQLTVDAHTLTAATGKPVRFQIFMPESETAAVDVRGSRLSMTVDRWVLDGHGVVAVW